MAASFRPGWAFSCLNDSAYFCRTTAKALASSNQTRRLRHADPGRERASDPRWAGDAWWRALAALLAPDRRRAGLAPGAANQVRTAPRRGPRALQGQERERGPDPGPLRPPGGLPPLRTGRGARDLVRLPRLA